MILAIDWNVSSEIIPGWKTPNLYGLLFVTGLVLGFFVIKRMFKKEGIPEPMLDKLLIYVVLATIVGARLGHVLFYGPYFDGINSKGMMETGYFSHPIEIFKVWEGGLASHGAAFLLLLTLYYYSKKVSHRPMLWILDRIAAPIAIAACFIRLGNLVNHEIIGDPTNLPWGFIFNNAESEYLIEGVQVPRHPAQLYEAIYYFLTFILLMFLFWKTRSKYRPGIIFGVFMIMLWTGRFFIEFVKVGQTTRDDIWALNTGQLLSIPLALAGVMILIYGLRSKEKLFQGEAGTEISE